MLEGGVSIPLPRASHSLPNGEYIIGFRAHHVYLDPPSEDAVPVKAKVAITEITGSESFVHIHFADARWVAQVHGVRAISPDDTIQIYLVPERFFIFEPSGALASSPDVKLAA